jgi:hypothetical protein
MSETKTASCEPGACVLAVRRQGHAARPRHSIQILRGARCPKKLFMQTPAKAKRHSLTRPVACKPVCMHKFLETREQTNKNINTYCLRQIFALVVRPRAATPRVTSRERHTHNSKHPVLLGVDIFVDLVRGPATNTSDLARSHSTTSRKN